MTAPNKLIYSIVKRLIDILISITCLILFLPIMIAISILVRFFIGKPILFRQTRIGLNEEPFTLIKFTTMTNTVNTHGHLLPDKDRLTRLGKLLRKLSIDELPELWLVLKGEMSLVGPRPLLPEYLPLYNENQKTRHHVKPGITGLAQVSGRNHLSWEDKFSLDVDYVNQQSTLLDLWILWKTILVVIHGQGIQQLNHVTSEKFSGSIARK